MPSSEEILKLALIEGESTRALLPPLLAITVRQPWATAICDLGKRLENRAWKPPDVVLGQTIAIHAGRSFEEEGADWIAARRGIMLTAKTVPLGAVIALARLQRVVKRSDDLWFKGPYGWVLADIRPLEPISCKGKLGLWHVPMDVRKNIQTQFNHQVSDNFPRT